MSLTAGSRLGTYEILAPLGAGGMGEVYRARDSRLGRDVAVKVLPDAFLADPERLARFDREAHMLASLNHANVAAIYGLEESDGIRFLVLELVPGETLAERLAGGALALREGLSILRQIAEALEAAHESGVIHRDLKPSNVKITPEGKVKVLDFGLAKAFDADRSPADLSRSPTAGHEATRQGVILGTAAYMSPEQARGKPLDKRTDIWSFGCVFYEALAGRGAFDRETVSDTIAAILEREPQWEALPETVPKKIRDLLNRCLQKERERRLHDIADARIEIEEVLSEPSSAPGVAIAEPGPARRSRLGTLIAVAAASALAGALAVWLAPQRSGERETPRLARVARLTHDPGLSEWPTWSPDGSLLAFASDRSGDLEIYVRRVQGGQEVNVTADPGQDYQPALSPDGNSVAFVSTRSSRTGMIKIGATFGMEFRTFGGDIWVAPALGGRARRLAPDGNFPVWHPRGDRIAFVGGPEEHRSILEVPSGGGTPKVLLQSASSRWEIVRIQYAPRGAGISFESVEGEVLLLSAAGGAPRMLLNGRSHAWDASGERLYYLTRDPTGGTRLQVVGIDASGRVRGTPRTIGLMTGILRDLAVSRDGRQLAVSELDGSLNLTRLPLSAGGGAPAGPEEALSVGQVIDRYPSFSPDGRRIAFASDRLGPIEMWILDLTTRRQDRLELPGEDLGVNFALWSPDGRNLIVTRFYKDGTRSLWLAAVDGSQAEELRPPAPGLIGGAGSRDGRSLLFEARSGGVLQLFVLDLASRKERQLTSSAGDKWALDWSPDGRWVLFASNAGGPLQVWRVPASGGGEARLTSGDERIRHAFYSPDGRWIYVQPSHRNIYRIPAEGGPLQPVTAFPESGLFLEEPALSPDGHSLVYCRSNGGSSLWLLTIGSGGAEKNDGD
ncbi:MAG: protein kinase domain-containing protein [Thermoanaerobaculia bacterium]